MSGLLKLMAPRDWFGWIVRLPVTLFVIAGGVILIEEFALNGMDDAAANYARDVMIVAFPFVALFPALLQHTANLQDSLAQLASTDPLTGLMNRRTFFAEVKRHLSRSGDGHTLIMLDFDHFKTINDTHGHPTGDACLVEVSKLLCANVRSEDAVARIGGEEFAIFLPRTSPEQARSIGERLVRGVDFELSSGRQETITLSAGIAECCGSDMTDMLKRADDALYEAKQAGRRRYAVSMVE